jgi:type II secretion system protein H
MRCTPTAGASGFTLIELILVMALLTIALAVTFPTLRGFFHGRVLDSEARRMLALTRYGQSRAISEGIPMVLWIDSRAKAYGLEMAVTYSDQDVKALEFEMDDDVELEVSEAAPRARTTEFDAPAVTFTGPREAASGRRLAGLPMIQLLPDGGIGETSPRHVALRQGETEAVWLVQSTNRLGYELSKVEPSARPAVGLSGATRRAVF